MPSCSSRRCPYPCLPGQDPRDQVRGRGHGAGGPQEQFAKDVLLLRLVGIRPVIVPRGPQIGALLKRLGKDSTFVAACASPTRRRCRASRWSWSGYQQGDRGSHQSPRRPRGGALRQGREPAPGPQAAAPDADGTQVDIGLVGEVEAVNPEPIRCSRRTASPGDRPGRGGAAGETYNINADLVAGDVAAACSRRADPPHRRPRHQRRGRPSDLDAHQRDAERRSRRA